MDHSLFYFSVLSHKFDYFGTIGYKGTRSKLHKNIGEDLVKQVMMNAYVVKI